MATELESEVSFEAVVDSASLRDARQEVEEELGDLEVSVDAVAQTGGSGGRRRGGQNKGPGSITQTNSYLDGLDDLAVERNDLLRELIDETEMGNRTGGRDGLGGVGGGLLGVLGLGLGAGAVGLSGLTDALEGFDPEFPEFPDGIPLVNVPDGVPLTGVPDGIPLVDVPESIPIGDLPFPVPIPIDLPGPIAVESPGTVTVETRAPAPQESAASVTDPEDTVGPDPASERAILNDAPTAYQQTAQAAPVDDPAERSTLRGQAIVAGAGALASGIDYASGFDERFRESATEAWNAPFPTMNPNVPADRATTGEGATRLGQATAFGGFGAGAASLVGGGAARAGLGAAIGLAGASGAATAEQSDDSGNRSTTRREETNVTIEVDAREGRNSRNVTREIQRKLPELERRLSQLEGALRGRR